MFEVFDPMTNRQLFKSKHKQTCVEYKTELGKKDFWLANRLQIKPVLEEIKP